MGTLFEEGISAYECKSYQDAYRLFEQAAIKKSSDAMVNLAIMNLRGLGCERNLEATKEWLHRATTLGHTHAMMSLAHFYEKGMDGTPHNKNALEYYVQAANSGVVQTQLKAGILYKELGDTIKSMQYLIMAAHNNNAQAQEMITYVSNAGIDAYFNEMFRALDESQQRALVENMIQTKIRPTLEADSGGIELVNYLSGKTPQVWLHYLGACSGCHLGSTSTADMLLDQFEALIDKNVVLYLM